MQVKEREIALITIAPQFAYGHDGLPPSIPPHATLCYEVELLQIVQLLGIQSQNITVRLEYLMKIEILITQCG